MCGSENLMPLGKKISHYFQEIDGSSGLQRRSIKDDLKVLFWGVIWFSLVQLSWENVGWTFIIGILGLIGWVVLVTWIKIYRRGKASMNWPTVEGEIITSTHFYIEYSYNVNGKEYTSDQIKIRKRPSRYSAKSIEKYPLGKRVTVYYFPSQPLTRSVSASFPGSDVGNAVLEPGYSLIIALIMFFISALLIFGALFFPYVLNSSIPILEFLVKDSVSILPLLGESILIGIFLSIYTPILILGFYGLLVLVLSGSTPEELSVYTKNYLLGLVVSYFLYILGILIYLLIPLDNLYYILIVNYFILIILGVIGGCILGFVPIPTIGNHFGKKAAMEAKASEAWPSVQGTIINHSFKKRREFQFLFTGEDDPLFKIYYQPRVKFTYSIDGKRYISRKITTSKHFNLSGIATKRYSKDFENCQLFARFPVGKMINVFYEPDRKKNGILLPGIHDASLRDEKARTTIREWTQDSRWKTHNPSFFTDNVPRDTLKIGLGLTFASLGGLFIADYLLFINDLQNPLGELVSGIIGVLFLFCFIYSLFSTYFKVIRDKY